MATNNSSSYEKDLVDTATDEFFKGIEIDKHDQHSNSTNNAKNYQSLNNNNTKDSSYINIITSRGNGLEPRSTKHNYHNSCESPLKFWENNGRQDFYEKKIDFFKSSLKENYMNLKKNEDFTSLKNQVI